jgi:GNAT superfamily N-acetyltransferase
MNTKTKTIESPASSLQSHWHRLAEVYRYEGAHRILVRTVKKVCKPIVEVNRFSFNERNLTITHAPVKARVPLEIRLLRIEEAEDFAEVFNQSVDRIRQRLAEEDQCMLGIVDKQMVHFQWFSVSSKLHHVPVAESGLAIVIKPGDVYISSAYTLRNWRGKGIAAEVAAVKHQYLRSLGCTRKFSYHRVENIMSPRAFTKNGRERSATRTVWVISLFGSRWRWVFGAANDQSFSFVRVP